MSSRKVAVYHPFFDMDPEEFLFQRYAGIPPEFLSLSPSRWPQRMLNRCHLPSLSQLWEQHFGGAPFPTSKDDQPKAAVVSPQSFYVRTPDFVRQISGGTSEIMMDDTTFKVSLDVHQFTPDELDVRVTDGEIVIHAKHEERVDEHGYVSREFTRRYRLPDDIDSDTVKSALSLKGILSVEAPRRKLSKDSQGKKIPIEVQSVSQDPAVKGASASRDGQK